MLTRKSSLCLILLSATALVLLFALFPTEANAQCALCRTALEKGGEQTARAINSGIIVLLAPAVAIFCSFFVIVLKSRNADEDIDQ